MRILIITISMLCIVCVSGQAETYLFVGDHFPLLCEKLPDATIQGLAIDVATIIGKRLGHTIQFKLYPWKRAQNMVKDGDADVLIPPYKTSEREKWLDFSAEPFNIDLGVFYVLSDSFISWEGKYTMLAGKRIGVVLGWNYGQNFETMKNALLLDSASGIDNTFKKLIAGRIDLAATNEREAIASIQRLGIHDKVKELLPPIHQGGNYFGFSKQKKLHHLRQQFDELLHKMIESGELRELQKKYRLNVGQGQ